MALLGPVVVVAESPATDFIDVLAKAGAFPIAQTRWADVPAAIAETTREGDPLLQPGDRLFATVAPVMEIGHFVERT